MISAKTEFSRRIRYLQLRILCTQIDHGRVKKGRDPLFMKKLHNTVCRNNKALYKQGAQKGKEISHVEGSVSPIEQHCVKMCNVAQWSFIRNLIRVGLRQT